MIDVADLPTYAVLANSPHADDWDAPDDDGIDPMTKDELVRLADRGDPAARRVIANCMECVGEMALIDGASDEELGEWYADARDEVSS